MDEFIKYVGLDVHGKTIAVAVADNRSSEVRFMGQIENTAEAMVKLVNQLNNTANDGVNNDRVRLSFCYEAGPCGYGIHRQLSELKHDCQVIAPSLIPKKAGDRIKTDRRDALMLARLHRAHELTPVWVPDGEHEALRDLTRARGDMKDAERRARQRLLAFLLRHGRRYDGKSNWTQAHARWLETVKFEHPTQQIVLQEYIDCVTACTKRVAAFDKLIAQAAAKSAQWPVIQALMALRGIALLSATLIVAEIGDIKRFATAPQLMAYLGLVPSEHSSGERQRRGAITKTGNSHVRRVLVEAAWTYRFPARKTRILQARAERCDEAVQVIAWDAQKRLCHRYQHLLAGGKLKVEACTAVARELAGFIWAIGQAMPGLPSAPAAAHATARVGAPVARVDVRVGVGGSKAARNGSGKVSSKLKPSL
jgi:transposase